MKIPLLAVVLALAPGVRAQEGAVISGVENGVVRLVNGLSLAQGSGAIIVTFPGGKTRVLPGVSMSVDDEKVTLTRPLSGYSDEPNIKMEHTYLKTESQAIYRKLVTQTGFQVATRMHVNSTEKDNSGQTEDKYPYYYGDLVAGPKGAYKESHLGTIVQGDDRAERLKLTASMLDGSYTKPGGRYHWTPIIPASWILLPKSLLEASAGAGSPNPAPSKQLQDAGKKVKKLGEAAEGSWPGSR